MCGASLCHVVLDMRGNSVSRCDQCEGISVIRCVRCEGHLSVTLCSMPLASPFHFVYYVSGISVSRCALCEWHLCVTLCLM
ncbi:hypothetical protein DPMN_108102 [Dreissena polymorpha]|uniref:Uncharacterized protein n=1 Tax=Dreissena polymorpha TaxID=45954 RepID=A0A9D4QLP2_DREPO|nr:hypothetical protein DPMN_108102 [Dreissena polymorpha]